jgi:hypothetical protein
MIIGYEPNIRQHTLIDTVLDTNKNYIITVDLQDTRCVEFTVKWASPRPWLYVGDTDELCTPGVVSVDAFDYFQVANGYIYFTPLTRLQSPDSSSIGVNVYVRSHDMHFNTLQTERLPTSYTAESTLSPCAPGDMMVINPTSATLDGINESYFGEEPISFRSYLRRFATTSVPIFTKPNSGYTIMVAELRTVPEAYPNYGEITSTYNVLGNLFNYLRYAYLSMRGGLRKRITLQDSNSSSNAMVQVSLMYEDGYIPPFTTFQGILRDMNQTGAVMFNPQTNTGVEFEIPWYSSNTWGFGQTAITLPDAPWSFSLSSKRYRIEYPIGGSARTVRMYEHTAFGEDFSLANFIAAPAMVFYVVP